MEETSGDGDSKRVALVVATVGRLYELERLLSSLSLQTFKNFKVLIADQNPAGFLDPLVEMYDQQLRLERFAAPKGVSSARNAALARCDADIVGFPDDDCWYEPDTLQRVVGAFAGGECHAVVGGSSLWSSARQKKKSCRLSKLELFRRTPTWAYFVTSVAANCVGGFDEALGPGPKSAFACGEDTDYLLRMYEAGFTIQRDESIWVHHPAPDLDDPGQAEKAYAYGQGRAHLLKKYKCGIPFKLLHLVHPLLHALAPMSSSKKKRYYRALLKGRWDGLKTE